MESTGTRNKIQISEATADILTKSGMSNWITPREDAVEAKGKGFLKTFWVNRNGKDESAIKRTPLVSDLDGTGNPAQLIIASTSKTGRLVDWMVDLLLIHVKKMVSHNMVRQNRETQICDNRLRVRFLTRFLAACIATILSLSRLLFDSWIQT
jgi:hypothetical protein